MQTIVLAGGYAKRLWPITFHRPKPLLPVAGKPVLDWILGQLPATRPLVSVNRKFAPQFEAWARGREVQLVVEETRAEEEKLGAIRALHQLVDALQLDDDLLVVAGDNLVELDFSAFVAAFRGTTLVALHDIGDAAKAVRRYGVAVVDGHRVVRFYEKPEQPVSSLVSTACYLFPRRVLSLLLQFLAEAPHGHDAPGYFLAWLLQREPIDAFVFSSAWFDIGDRESFIQANLHYTGGRSWVHPAAWVVDSVLERSVVLGPCRIEGCRLEGCVVDEEAHLSNVELRNALVGRGTWLAR